MEGESSGPEGWIESIGSAAGAAWGWWVGLSDAYAWQEIGAVLVPGLLVLAVLMFWGIRRMQLGD